MEAAAPSLTNHISRGQQSRAWVQGEGNQAVEAERKARGNKEPSLRNRGAGGTVQPKGASSRGRP